MEFSKFKSMIPKQIKREVIRTQKQEKSQILNHLGISKRLNLVSKSRINSKIELDFYKITQSASERILINDLNRMISQRMNSEENLIDEKDNSFELKSIMKIKINNHNSRRRELRTFQNVFESMSENELLEIKSVNFVLIIFNPKFKKIWDLAIFTIILISCLITPYMISTHQLYLTRLESIVEIILIIDIIMHFFSNMKIETDQLKNQHPLIILNYLAESFFIDFFSAFPICLLNSSINKRSNSVFSIFSEFSIFFWFKMVRVYKLIKYDFFEKAIFKKFHFSRMFKLILSFYLFCHIATCFWIYIGNSNYDKINWISQFQYDSRKSVELYVASLYFTFVTIITVGYGDILSVNILETSYNIFLLIFGVLFYTFTVSTLSSLFSTEEKKFIYYKDRIKFLEDIDFEFNIPKELYKKLKNHFKVEIIENSKDKLILLNSLPTNLKNQLTAHMYKDIIYNFVFFEDQNYDFVKFVLPFLKKKFFNKRETLFSSGEIVSEMYFPIGNSLTVSLDYKHKNIDILLINRYNHFGEVLMLTNEVSPYNLISKQRTNQVLFLKKQDFFFIKNNFNYEIQNILMKSYQLMEKIDIKTDIFISLFENFGELFGAQSFFQKINIYLMDQGFKEFFYFNKDFEDASTYIKNHKYDELISLLNKIFSERQSNINVIKENIRKFSGFSKPTYNKNKSERKISAKLIENQYILGNSDNQIKSPFSYQLNMNQVKLLNNEREDIKNTFKDLKKKKKNSSQKRLSEVLVRNIISQFDIQETEFFKSNDFDEVTSNILDYQNLSVNKDNISGQKNILDKKANISLSSKNYDELKIYYESLSANNKSLLRSLMMEDSKVNFKISRENEFSIESLKFNSKKFKKINVESFLILPSEENNDHELIRSIHTIKTNILGQEKKIFRMLAGKKEKISKILSSSVLNSLSKNCVNNNNVPVYKNSTKSIKKNNSISNKNQRRLNENERLDQIFNLIIRLNY